MKKKLLALVLAATMVIGMGISASAADVSTGDVSGQLVSGTIDLDADVEECTILVTISKTGDVIANPYELEVTDARTSTNVTDSLVGATITVENKSNVPIAVNITGKLTLASTVTAGTTLAAVEANTTAKQVYVQALVFKSGTTDTYLNKATYNAKSETYTVAQVAPLVYSAKGTSIATVPVLAAKDKAKADLYSTKLSDKTAMSVEAIDVVISGATSNPATATWKDGTDTVKVTTVYDLKLAKSTDVTPFVKVTASSN